MILALLSAQDLVTIRRRWERDVGIAAGDVIRVLDHAEVIVEVARHSANREAIMRETLGAVQARCTELREENLAMKAVFDQFAEGNPKL